MILKQLLKKRRLGFKKVVVKEKSELVDFVRDQFLQMNKKNLSLPIQVVKL